MKIERQNKKIIAAVAAVVLVLILAVLLIVFLKKPSENVPVINTDLEASQSETQEEKSQKETALLQTKNEKQTQNFKNPTEAQTEKISDEYEVNEELTDIKGEVRVSSQGKKELCVTVHHKNAFIHRLSLERKGTAVTVRAYAHGKGDKACSIAIPLENVDEIYFRYVLIYKNGRVIDPKTTVLLSYSTLSGENTDVLSSCMMESGIEPSPIIENNFNESARGEPYIVFFKYSKNLNTKEKLKAKNAAYLFMAIFEIEKIEISDSSGYKKTVTIKDADRDFKRALDEYNRKNNKSEAFKGSVTDYTKNEYALQLLRDVLDI